MGDTKNVQEKLNNGLSNNFCPVGDIKTSNYDVLQKVKCNKTEIVEYDLILQLSGINNRREKVSTNSEDTKETETDTEHLHDQQDAPLNFIRDVEIISSSGYLLSSDSNNAIVSGNNIQKSDLSMAEHNGECVLANEEFTIGANDFLNKTDKCIINASSEIVDDINNEPKTEILVAKSVQADPKIRTEDKASKDCLNEEVDPFVESRHISDSVVNDKLQNIKQNNKNIGPSYINLEQIRNIGRSTISLNCEETKEKMLVDNPALSKSVENLSCLPEIKSKSIVDPIDSQKVLDAQTNKGSLPLSNKIHEQILPRTHKEIITQDFGSIVKNVHGIFSSVSGSLKHAYNISQKMPSQQNINKMLATGSLKNTANGKLISHIFDSNIDSGILNSNSESPNIDNRNAVDEVASICYDLNKEFSIAEENKTESLERVLMNERLKTATLKDKMIKQTEELAEREREKIEMEAKIDALRRQAEELEREKDSAVMRYAVSESAVIGAREAAELARRTERAARNETELLAGKLKSAHAEKQRICQIYDDKCHLLETSERETSRLKEELQEREGRLKWTQSKLRTETEAYREAVANVERLTAQVSELETAREAAIANSSDAGRVRQLESELKEALASSILHRHENKELERRLTSSSRQLDTCQKSLQEATATVANLQKQVTELTANNRQLEEEAAELASLRARAALADTLTQQLERQSERAARAEEETARERARAETCARREADALQHAARLTAEHVGEQAQLRQHENTARALGADNASLRERVSALEVAATEARAQLARETTRRTNECRLLARKVAELTEELQQANKQLEWEKGENDVLRKKHASAVKELNRELQRALKRCDALEARAASEQPEPSTPTGSISSLGSMDNGGGTAATTAASSASEVCKVNGHVADSVPDIQVRTPAPDRQTLIERIVQLQRNGARRAERCDFLEEHNRQLTAELRDKTRLLRELLAGQPTGALSGNAADDNKREMARLGGGAMAAVWGGAADGITLELSLEMNRKLQAVLEDSLLKNITLKKNIDTLGEEIARIKAQQNNKDST